MTYTKISLYTSNGIPEALSNLWYRTESSVVEIQDAVEDAQNGKDLLRRLGNRPFARVRPVKSRPKMYKSSGE